MGFLGHLPAPSGCRQRLTSVKRAGCAWRIERAAKESWVAQPSEPFPGQASSSFNACFYAQPAKTGPTQFLATPKTMLTDQEVRDRGPD